MTVLFWRQEIVCQQWVELVTDYLEGRLPRRTVAAVDRHLAGCPHCREYLAQMRTTIRLTGTLPDEPVPAELLDAFQASFEEQHREDGGAG